MYPLKSARLQDYSITTIDPHVSNTVDVDFCGLPMCGGCCVFTILQNLQMCALSQAFQIANTCCVKETKIIFDDLFVKIEWGRGIVKPFYILHISV